MALISELIESGEFMLIAPDVAMPTDLVEHGAHALAYVTYSKQYPDREGEWHDMADEFWPAFLDVSTDNLVGLFRRSRESRIAAG